MELNHLPVEREDTIEGHSDREGGTCGNIDWLEVMGEEKQQRQLSYAAYYFFSSRFAAIDERSKKLFNLRNLTRFRRYHLRSISLTMHKMKKRNALKTSKNITCCSKEKTQKRT
ncbi:hypothetical protein CDAR_294881 [Caerostris darwini]|uniref:Uncharacterized protein n=1 Tax=Caerostris darwini TaxID=1538125 RepID=A0AAV4UKN2_9ARAC|nr:hypothetical protein CDAR_294881 [Caerostris darwini]